MRAWLFNGTNGGMEKNLYLSNDAPEPPTDLKKNEVRLQTIAMSVNPVDYKVPELPVAGRLVVSTPASPGMDFSAKVLATGSAVDSVAVGDVVFGKLDMPTKFGPLGAVMVAGAHTIVPVPAGVSPEDAATIGVCGLTAYQTVAKRCSEGASVLINGGSGGTGTFGIQLAKARGCAVTASCSTPNVQLCKELGADDVIDYKTVSGGLVAALKAKGQVFDLVVDNVGSPRDLYAESHHFLKPNGKFVQIGAEPGQFSSMLNVGSRMALPSFLGGGKRSFEFVSVKQNQDDLKAVAALMAEKKVKATISQVYKFEDAPKAYEQLKTGRTRGKLVVIVGPE